MREVPTASCEHHSLTTLMWTLIRTLRQPTLLTIAVSMWAMWITHLTN